VGTHKAGGDNDEVGCEEGIAQHFAEDDDFGGVDSAIVGGRERDDARTGLFFPETEGGGIEMGSDGLISVTPDSRETTGGPWHNFILRWWVELVEGVYGLRRWCCVYCVRG